MREAVPLGKPDGTGRPQARESIDVDQCALASGAAFPAASLGATAEAAGSPISPSIARILVGLARPGPAADRQLDPPGPDLRERESQILGFVAKGFNFPEIGKLSGISTNTVRTHIYRIYRKLSVHSRGEAVFDAQKLGLLDF